MQCGARNYPQQTCNDTTKIVRFGEWDVHANSAQTLSGLGGGGSGVSVQTIFKCRTSLHMIFGGGGMFRAPTSACIARAFH